MSIVSRDSDIAELIDALPGYVEVARTVDRSRWTVRIGIGISAKYPNVVHTDLREALLKAHEVVQVNWPKGIPFVI